MHPNRLLTSYGISPKKSLGQNFIYDPQILSKIVATARVEAFDSVLEIGSGLGSLTRELATYAERVVAIEIDERLIPLLSDQLIDQENVRIIQGDILNLNLDDLFDTEYKVIANIPYYITGAILRHMYSAVNKPTLMVLTIQREVAERMAAQPGNMSILSTSVQLYADIEILFTISAASFWPRPDVDSAVVRLSLHEQPLIKPEDEPEFLNLVKIAFSQKRKQLQKNLRMLDRPRDEVMTSLALADIDGRRRAETLAIEEWLALYKALS